MMIHCHTQCLTCGQDLTGSEYSSTLQVFDRRITRLSQPQYSVMQRCQLPERTSMCGAGAACDSQQWASTAAGLRLV